MTSRVRVRVRVRARLNVGPANHTADGIAAPIERSTDPVRPRFGRGRGLGRGRGIE